MSFHESNCTLQGVKRQISIAQQHCIVRLSVRNRSNAEKCFIHSFQSPFRKVKIPASQSYRRYQKDNFLKEFIKLMHHHLPDKDSFNAEPVNHQLRPPPTLCVYPFLMDCVYKGWVIHYPPVRTAYKRLHSGLSLRYALCDRDCPLLACPQCHELSLPPLDQSAQACPIACVPTHFVTSIWGYTKRQVT